MTIEKQYTNILDVGIVVDSQGSVVVSAGLTCSIIVIIILLEAFRKSQGNQPIVGFLPHSDRLPDWH